MDKDDCQAGYVGGALVKLQPQVSEVKAQLVDVSSTWLQTAVTKVEAGLSRMTLAFSVEHQAFLPKPSATSLHEQCWVVLWFLALTFLCLRLLAVTTKLAVKVLVVLPRKILGVAGRCCFRCFCPCERKGNKGIQKV